MIIGPDFQPSPTCAIMPIVIVYHENFYVNFTHSKYLFIRLHSINVKKVAHISEHSLILI